MAWKFFNSSGQEIVSDTVADNSVTLAKLEHGTQGDVLYYGASGAPTRLGYGTSGHFLKTQGTGANPLWAAAGGATIVEVYRTSNESVAYATHEILDWQAQEIGLLDGSANSTQWTSGAASKLICKSAGVYVVTAYVSWNTLASGAGEINLKMWKNRNDSGGTVGVQGASAVHNGRLGQQFTRTVNLAVDDYMEIGVYHSSNDGSSNISRTLESFSDTGTPVVRNAPFFSMYKL